MTEPGKNAPGLKGFPTPNSAADAFGYLLLYFDDNSWAQWALGALQALGYSWNWYESGDLSPEEAASIWADIIASAPLNLLPSEDECALPDGKGRLLRLGATGHTEMQDGSSWVEPTGEYEVPPVPARSGGTADEQNCLAAANAANVMQQLYEQLSDDWNAGLATAEAIADLVTGIGALIGAPFGAAAEALVAIARLVFQVVYETVAFIGADVWTGNFTDALKQVLVCCASNDAGVVTFDFQCVLDGLARQTNVFDLSFAQIRLFGQLYFILQWIGADGLNAAGATTAVLTASCDVCSWCHTFLFADNDGGFSVPAGQGGAYSAGVGWVASDVFAGGTYRRTVFIELLGFSSATVNEIALSFVFAHGSYSTVVTKQAIFDQDGVLLAGGTTTPPDGDNTLRWTGTRTMTGVKFVVTASSQATAVFSGSATIYQVTLRGVGENPFGDNNCP